MSSDRLIADTDLSATAHQVLRAIESAPPEKNGWRTLSLSALQRMTQRTKNTIRRALLQLEFHGYVMINFDRQPGKMRATKQYLVVGDEEGHNG